MGWLNCNLNWTPPQTTYTVYFSKSYKSCNINYSIILLISRLPEDLLLCMKAIHEVPIIDSLVMRGLTPKNISLLNASGARGAPLGEITSASQSALGEASSHQIPSLHFINPVPLDAFILLTTLRYNS